MAPDVQMNLHSGGAALKCTDWVKQVGALQRYNLGRDHSVADASVVFRGPEAVKARFRDGTVKDSGLHSRPHKITPVLGIQLQGSTIFDLSGDG